MSLPTDATVRFLREHLPLHARTAIEVGCGRGEVAAALGAAGLRVIALDPDADAVAMARRLGADARVARWPDFTGGPVDAVLFTRSLHHVPLHAALDRARELLTPGGRVLVEDFAYQDLDPRLLSWFVAATRGLDPDVLRRGTDPFLHRLLAADEPARAWHEEHDHGLHSARTMRAALAERLVLIHEADAPYCYRYLAAALGSDPGAEAILRWCHDQEEQVARADGFPMLGRRYVAQR